MKRWGLLIALCLLGPLQGQTLNLWRQGPSGFAPDARLGDTPQAMGSLQKPFVAKAWIQAHPQVAPPRFKCVPGSRCWFKPGHGEVGLTRALSVSCNSYFLQLAEATPPADLARTLGEAGFQPAPADAGEAIGLQGPHGFLSIRPSQVIEAYARLVREPWLSGEALRGEVLSGLREAALSGTASGLRHRGYWAKTGTVPASPGNTLRTVGWALAIDDAGFAFLARRNPGTGREAAAELRRVIEGQHPGSALHGVAPSTLEKTSQVIVRLFDLLPASTWTVKNVGTAPVSASGGFLGPGASYILQPGDRVGPGALEVIDAAHGLRRRLEGALSCVEGAHPHLVANLSPKVYVEGVLAGELPHGRHELRIPLAAAVLRFIAQGRRHVDADVCDNTHCAWFVGRGPRMTWRDSLRAVASEEALPAPLSEEEWSQAQREARLPGPHLWSGHCGGRSLTEHVVWGGAGKDVVPCPRHAEGSDAWERAWPVSAVTRAFGKGLTRLEVGDRGGQWMLFVWHGTQATPLTFDEAHRRIASALGWDALPSPADRIELSDEGCRAFGTGHGHRVGLCLGE